MQMECVIRLKMWMGCVLKSILKNLLYIHPIRMTMLEVRRKDFLKKNNEKAKG